MNQNVDLVVAFLEAYEPADVRAALKQYSLSRRLHTKQGWVLWDGPVPDGYEWTEINGRMFIRTPDPHAEDTRGPSAPETNPKKTDTSVSVISELTCPACGGSMYKEPVCPGCEDGKKGYRIRLLCGECDLTLLL